MTKIWLACLLFCVPCSRGAAELCKNDYLGFSVSSPDGWRAEKLYWEGEKDPSPGETFQRQVGSALPPKLTEWTGKEIGCRFSGPGGQIFVRATTAPTPEPIPFQEYNGEWDIPAPATSFERLLSSEVFISSYGARGVFALRGPCGPAADTVRVYYFPLLEGKKLWEMRFLSMLLFVHPSKGQESAAADMLARTAASFAFYGGSGSEFDEDDDGKLFSAAMGSVYYLRLPLADGQHWRPYLVEAEKLRVAALPAVGAMAVWELVPLAYGRTELVLRLYDKKEQAIKEFSLRFKVKK
ncbi:MAG TPA: hypothetical protein PLL10_02765 [Elusimicrobiales bacterium]|nr:hypothetical protein [Elusimicrobiales bacterium]